jgi:hypothetical protein
MGSAASGTYRGKAVGLHGVGYDHDEYAHKAKTAASLAGV